MDDLISRQAAIDICRAPHMRNADCSDFEMAIMMLPPAQPEPSQLGTNLAEVGTDTISRQAAIDAILHITNCKSVRELFEYNQAHHLTEMWGGGVNDAIDAVIGVESATDKNIGTKNRKKILDVTCGSRSIWFNKQHPNTVYCDIREEEHHGLFGTGNHKKARDIYVKPDIICDFTDLPFDDNTFNLVVFDPPHVAGLSEKSWTRKMYGTLKSGWEKTLHDGFTECMRVLKPDGVLIFKWSETSICAADVWKSIGQKPLFGHHSGKKMNTYWGVFMKGEE